MPPCGYGIKTKADGKSCLIATSTNPLLLKFKYYLVQLWKKASLSTDPFSHNLQVRDEEPASLFILISSKQISSINFFLNIIQITVIAISDNCMTFSFEFGKIVDNFAAEESCAVF